MTKLHDLPKAVTCAKQTLWVVTRTACLLMAAVLASVLLVRLPISADEHSTPYVPASEKWIDLEAPSRTAPSMVAAPVES